MSDLNVFNYLENLQKGQIIKGLTYISLFSSSGIGCYGFKKQDYICIATNEYLEKRLKIQQYNSKCRFSTGYIHGDISKKETQDKIYKELENNNIKDLDVIIATPPCQGMSVANHKKKNETKRNSLVVESIKIVNKIKPKIFIFENVRAFLNTICTDIDDIEKSISKAIELQLAGEYNILSKVINFKDYGSHSSRTRTLVIGVRKDLVNISPYQLFPKKQKAKILKELISDLPSLTTIGEIDQDDIYHAFRKYDKKMLPWIENIKEGQSAFDNSEPHRIPHQIKDGDKYSRWYWDRVAPCIHTRNDILASQSTIHPTDNRVFSIRELMRMMTIPDDFRWSNREFKELNSLSITEKERFELNIRHCIGEAVPTKIFEQIASNIRKVFSYKNYSINEINKMIEEENLLDRGMLKTFLTNNPKKMDLNALYHIAELSNLRRNETKAYFTRNNIVFNVINRLPEFKGKKNRVPKNFTINFICVDFLLWKNEYQYDLVIGNPPFGKVTKNRELLNRYKQNAYNQKTNNLFSFFIEKSCQIAKTVSLIVPKSLINSPEFNETREFLEKQNLHSITDYGEKAFKGVKIETISFLLDTTSKKVKERIGIESYITNDIIYQQKEYIFAKEFPYWLIYRNAFFDMVVDKMELDIYESFRDRQITKKHTLNQGTIRVLKSRNIASNSIKNIENYDCFIDDIDSFIVSKYLNQNNIILIPNLTYNPRATFLPKNSIADGSVALLKVKNKIKVTPNHLEYYNTEEFIAYYKIARNRGTRSLNIDNNSVKFFGLLKDAN